ncbi:hypothetical protein OH76DRAFT_1484772 [Lentinus brumalis]|uniref:Uncharacterized protein n=1 Tax=Lentinus brumalis TaxID=2498619 RepID=A0A371D4F1_9APHY|nr:hypothetical protein OH76DRAFT_1484772 [Polyporus brumalis]
MDAQLPNVARVNSEIVLNQDSLAPLADPASSTPDSTPDSPTDPTTDSTTDAGADGDTKGSGTGVNLSGPLRDSDSDPSSVSGSVKWGTYRSTEDATEDDDPLLPAPEPTTPESDAEFAPLVDSFSSWKLGSAPATPGLRRFTKVARRTPDMHDDDRSFLSQDIAFPANFLHTVRQVERVQAQLDKRTTELEEEMANLRTEFATSVRTSKTLLLKTQATITSERRTMEKAHEGAIDSVRPLEQKLARAQCAIATLQAQHNADKSAMERMANDIAEVLAIQEDMGCRLERLDESEQSLRLTAGMTRELVTDLIDEPSSCDEVSLRTLADELRVNSPSPLASKSTTSSTPDIDVEHDMISPLAHKSKPLPAPGGQSLRWSPIPLSLSSHTYLRVHARSIRNSSVHPLSQSSSPPEVAPLEVQAPRSVSPTQPLTVQSEDVRSVYVMVPLRFLTAVQMRSAGYWFSTMATARRSSRYCGDTIRSLRPLFGCFSAFAAGNMYM